MDELTELQSARRIAAAADQRRRRVERTMHDGVQQHLALVGLKLSLLRERVRQDPDAAEALCLEVSESLLAAQRELRELAHSIYPVVLENEGLVAALADSVSRLHLDAEVEAVGVTRHSREVETAMYFCCLEALANVDRHAGTDAAITTVTLSEHDSSLEFAVSHDGRDMDLVSLEADGGFQHAADRLSAMGGHLELVSSPDQGVTVRGSVPVTDDTAGLQNVPVPAAGTR